MRAREGAALGADLLARLDALEASGAHRGRTGAGNGWCGSAIGCRPR